MSSFKVIFFALKIFRGGICCMPAALLFNPRGVYSLQNGFLWCLNDKNVLHCCFGPRVKGQCRLTPPNSSFPYQQC